ncbi:MAG: hypothetical protein N2Z62_05985 [Rhodobacteraceae bacterium]|nr:hypothetical protein [Paracoccaceae bacterium]
MRGFLRPELHARLLRWREAAIGALVALAGVWGVATAGGAVFLAALFALFVGLALVWGGVRRARFPGGGQGPGLVEVDERQVTYFGPGGGAAVSIDALTRVEIVTNDAGPFASDLFWVFESEGMAPLIVPGDAVGAERLFDALTALPGVDFDQVLAATGSTEPRRFVIWSRTDLHRRLS